MNRKRLIRNQDSKIVAMFGAFYMCLWIQKLERYKKGNAFAEW